MCLSTFVLNIFCVSICPDAAAPGNNVQATFGSDLNKVGCLSFKDVRMIHANTSSGSTCHSIRAFQDEINLGDVYYAGVSVPLDICQPT
jgi:hypothetical protein